MPKPIVSIPKRKERKSFISSVITGEMERYGKSEQEMSMIADVSSRTFQTRMKDPETFTVGELYRVMDALDVKILFVRKQQPG